MRGSAEQGVVVKTGTRCLGELGKGEAGEPVTVSGDIAPGFRKFLLPKEVRRARRAARARRQGHNVVALADSDLPPFGD